MRFGFVRWVRWVREFRIFVESFFIMWGRI